MTFEGWARPRFGAVAPAAWRQRLAIDCSCFAGRPTATTAAVMDCAVGTVESTLADARLRVRPVLAVTG